MAPFHDPTCYISAAPRRCTGKNQSREPLGARIACVVSVRRRAVFWHRDYSRLQRKRSARANGVVRSGHGDGQHAVVRDLATVARKSATTEANNLLGRHKPRYH